MQKAANSETRKSLLERVKDLKDQASWNEFVDRYGPEIYRWCIENGLQVSSAEDVTQEVLRKLVEKMQEFDYNQQKGSFRGWLKTVTKNTIRDLGKKWENRIAGSGKTDVNQFLHRIVGRESLAELQIAVENQHEKELFAEAEKRVKQRVKEKTWLAFQYTAIENLPAATVAEKLEMQISEVYIAKSRILKRLREEVKSMGVEAK